MVQPSHPDIVLSVLLCSQVIKYTFNNQTTLKNKMIDRSITLDNFFRILGIRFSDICWSLTLAIMMKISLCKGGSVSPCRCSCPTLLPVASNKPR